MISNDPGGKLEQAFWRYHFKNPIVYDLYVKYAREWKQYRSHCSIRLLSERIRWAYMIEIDRGDDNFKLNNNHTAFYARMIEAKEPDLQGFFRLRQQRVQCTFGPSNDSLPSGEHVA